MEDIRMSSNTCLAVVRDEDGFLWFGSDRRASWSFAKATQLERPKSVFRNGVLMMITGSAYLGIEIIDHMKFKKFTGKEDPDKYVHDVLFPAMITHFTKLGLMHKEEKRLSKKVDNKWSGVIVVAGVGSAVYELVIDNEGVEFDRVGAPWAHGCGGALALGSLLTTESITMSNYIITDMGPTPEQRLKIAVTVAAKVSPGCDAFVDVITNRPKGK